MLELVAGLANQLRRQREQRRSGHLLQREACAAAMNIPGHGGEGHDRSAAEQGSEREVSVVVFWNRLS